MSSLKSCVVGVVTSFFVAATSSALAENLSQPVSPDDQYVLGRDSQPQAGVPQGTLQAFTLANSKIYPDHSHAWWLYVPVQYDGEKPIALMVFLDGSLLGFVQRDCDVG